MDVVDLNEKRAVATFRELRARQEESSVGDNDSTATQLGICAKILVAKHRGCNCAHLTLADISYPSEACIVTGLATARRSRLGSVEQGGK
jgi:hypothetical protein